MATLKFVSASIAASDTTNVESGRPEQVAPYERTLIGLAVTIRDNTPALGDITYQLRAGQQIIAEGRGMLEHTTGAEVIVPDDLDQIGMKIGANVPLTLDVTNTDAAAAHSSQIVMLWDRI